MRRNRSVTPETRVILSLLAEGKTIAEICNRVYLSEAAVKSRIRFARLKWGCATTVSAVAYALRKGVIE